MDFESSSSSLKHKIRSSVCFSCCFSSGSDPRLTISPRSRSADFRYDPLSYALNFDEGNGDDLEFADEEFRCRNFSSRLPASPPETQRAVVPVTVGVACS
ncbi:uncharacterized protein LOC109843649 [Asparagus officinalis]|uniref:uncharacterized protein LOC109843649 n=1 Tax=Asparagus officinalis TaxID=4686 RepID=UPI00098DE1C3|nr:uncharacterized protein LOC109843649 [Asparagus officinalis]